MARSRRRRRPQQPQSPPPQSQKAPKKGRKPGNASANVSERDLSSLLSYGPSFLPYTTAWTDNRVEQVRHFRHWVYVAIDRIACKISDSPPNVSRVSARAGSASPPRHFLAGRRKVLAPLLSHETLSPAPENHPLVKLLRDPNDPDTAWDLWYETILFLLLTGSAYWWVPKNKAGLPLAIWVVPSHWVWPVMGKDRLIEGWELRPVEGNYLRKTLPADEIIHFRRKNPVSKLDGYSTLTAINQWADTQESVNRARAQSYRNGTFPSVAVQFDGNLQDPTVEQLRRIEQKFLARYAAEVNANRPLFLPPGVKVIPLSIEPNQMVFGETSKETRDNILAAYGVPPLIAGIMEGMSYGSITAAQAGFMAFCINPLLSFLGQVLTEKLAWKYDASLRIWWEDMTPDDPAQVEREIKTDLVGCAISPNEIRMKRGREPWPYSWADLPVRPVNMAPGSLPGGGAHQEPDGLPSPEIDSPDVSAEE